MKPSLLFSILITFFTCVSSLSCSNSENLCYKDETSTDISIILGEEYSDFHNNIKDSTDGGYFIGIIVYCKKHIDNDDEIIYKHYASGLFSDSNNININLKRGYNYRFECMILEDGVDEVFASKFENGALVSGYFPYNNHVVNNQFIYDTINGFNFSNPYVSIRRCSDSLLTSEETISKNADVIMFYGAVDDFKSAGNNTVEIPMYRIGYGLKVSFDRAFDGKLSVNIESNDMIGEHANQGIDEKTNNTELILTENEEISKVFAEGLFSICEYPDWKEKIMEYEKNALVSFSLNKNDGTVEHFEKNVTFRRNKMTTLTLNLETKTEISFSLEDTDLEDETEIITFTPNE